MANNPMIFKMELASRIVSDFHSSEAAADAATKWQNQAQKGQVPDDLKHVIIPYGAVAAGAAEQSEAQMAVRQDSVKEPIRLSKLLKECGLVPSVNYGRMKIEEGAVSIDRQKTRDLIVSLPVGKDFLVGLGKHQIRSVRIVR